MKANYVEAGSSSDKKTTGKVEDRRMESLHLHNVSVTHNHETVNSISLKLHSGSIYGFVGNTEKRKLLIDLIHGFIKPDKGDIMINNTTRIDEISHWSSYIALIKKESQLFSGAMTTLSGSKEKTVMDSLTKTAFFDATAEALLKTAPVLLFDEAMGLLSIELEEEILRRLCLKNKSNIVILNTNRPGSLKYCDHIFMVKNNRISEVSKQAYFSDFSGIFNGFSDNYYNESIF